MNTKYYYVMTIFAHAAASILTGKIISSYKKEDFTPGVMFLFALAGVLPDLPLLLITITGNFTSQVHHHEWIFHTPLFWIATAAILKLWRKKLAMFILIGGLSHLATDWYGGGDGIMFLWPLNDTQYGVLLSGVHGRPAFENYFSHPLFLGLEVLLLIYLMVQMTWGVRAYTLRPGDIKNRSK